MAKENNCAAGVVTFDNQPVGVITGTFPGLVCTLRDRKTLLHQYGMDQVTVLHFDHLMRSVTYAHFFRTMVEKYNAAGFEILGYSIDDDLDRLHKFEEERKLPWKTASRKLTQEAEKDYVIISSYYGVNAIPTMVLVGKDGKVISTRARGEELKRLLAEQFPEVK
jgi:FAD synthase